MAKKDEEEKQHLYVDTIIRVNGEPVTVSAKVETEDIASRSYLPEVGRTNTEFDFTSVKQLSEWVKGINLACNKIVSTINHIPEEFKDK